MSLDFDKRTTEQKIRGIVADVLGLEETDDRLGLDIPYTETGMDSLDIIEIIMAVEEDLTVEIDDEAIANFRTLRDVTNHVKAKLGEPLIQ